MAHELQTAHIWKRLAAWMFDNILLGILAVGFGLILSALLGYNSHSRVLDDAYADYEAEYSVSFEISRTDYEAMTQAQRDNYNAAYEALIADGDAMYAYNMMISLSLVIISLGVLLAVMVWDFLIPLKLGNGQTLGKKIFGLCLVRCDGVKMNTMQLFARSVLGKYAIETMIPVLIVLMIFWGTMGVMGTVVLAALAVGQGICLLVTGSNSAIHDLLAGTAVVDYASKTIFGSAEELLEYQKKLAAERSARAPY